MDCNQAVTDNQTLYNENNNKHFYRKTLQGTLGQCLVWEREKTELI